MRSSRFLSIILLTFSALALGCGAVHLGTSSNDAAPNEPLLASGGFSGSVSGTALIYGENGNYILRLASLSAPSVSNLQAIITGNGVAVATLGLTTTTGNKNYSFSISSGASITFNTVTIHSPTTNTDYGTATLR
jgi:hypothetical protein